MLTGLKTGGENTTGDIVPFDDSAPGYQPAFCAFPAKERRSGSRVPLTPLVNAAALLRPLKSAGPPPRLPGFSSFSRGGGGERREPSFS